MANNIHSVQAEKYSQVMASTFEDGDIKKVWLSIHLDGASARAVLTKDQALQVCDAIQKAIKE